ncbi:hypothetical protein TWF694_005915 [Orbilia ellipsospora]|uniref:LAGLIDADG homing endonuclease n=1 Tax=Orbilia ellipsospora TaxID=2528407 RepID=A0AAV9WSA8_9PEZI
MTNEDTILQQPQRNLHQIHVPPKQGYLKIPIDLLEKSLNWDGYSIIQRDLGIRRICLPCRDETKTNNAPILIDIAISGIFTSFMKSNPPDDMYRKTSAARDTRGRPRGAGSYYYWTCDINPTDKNSPRTFPLQAKKHLEKFKN